MFVWRFSLTKARTWLSILIQSCRCEFRCTTQRGSCPRSSSVFFAQLQIRHLGTEILILDRLLLLKKKEWHKGNDHDLMIFHTGCTRLSEVGTRRYFTGFDGRWQWFKNIRHLQTLPHPTLFLDTLAKVREHVRGATKKKENLWILHERKRSITNTYSAGLKGRSSMWYKVEPHNFFTRQHFSIPDSTFSSSSVTWRQK